MQKTNEQARNDKRVKQHHKKMALQKAFRTKKEPKLPLGDGHIITGSIFDCNRSYFERLLKAYWDRLFLGWNPYKKDGRGCWEVWQEPIRKGDLDDMEHWVADLDYLTPAFIDELRRMDSWEHKKNTGYSMAKTMDDAYEEYEAEIQRKEDESIKYAVRHNKRLFGQLKGLAQDGYNPLWFFSDKKQGNGQA